MVQMAVGPAHRHLDDGVKPAEVGVGRHLQAPLLHSRTQVQYLS
jgi:hypothetical protein